MDDVVWNNLKEFQQWRKSSSTPDTYDIMDYVTCICTPDRLFGFGSLFKPQLINYDKCYIIKEKFDEELFKQWMSKLGDRTQVEWVMNHIDLCTLFQEEDEVLDVVAIKATELISGIWTDVFSSKGLKGDRFGSTIQDCGVTLYKIR